MCARGVDLPGYDGGAAEKADALEHRDAAKRSAVVGYVAFGAGAAAAIGATVLWLTGSSPSDAPSEATETTLAPMLAPHLAGAMLTGRF